MYGPRYLRHMEASKVASWTAWAVCNTAACAQMHADLSTILGCRCKETYAKAAWKAMISWQVSRMGSILLRVYMICAWKVVLSCQTCLRPGIDDVHKYPCFEMS